MTFDIPVYDGGYGESYRNKPARNKNFKKWVPYSNDVVGGF